MSPYIAYMDPMGMMINARCSDFMEINGGF